MSVSTVGEQSACVHVFVSACVCVRRCVRVCVRVCIHTHKHMHMHVLGETEHRCTNTLYVYTYIHGREIPKIIHTHTYIIRLLLQGKTIVKHMHTQIHIHAYIHDQSAVAREDYTAAKELKAKADGLKASLRFVGAPCLCICIYVHLCVLLSYRAVSTVQSGTYALLV